MHLHVGSYEAGVQGTDGIQCRELPPEGKRTPSQTQGRPAPPLLMAPWLQAPHLGASRCQGQATPGSQRLTRRGRPFICLEHSNHHSPLLFPPRVSAKMPPPQGDLP